ncbi:MAG: hypothetical protein ACR2IF_07545 [Terriglobales bacterium]
MIKKLSIVVLLLISALAFADKNESVDALKARLNTTSGGDHVVLCTKIAERQLDTLDKAYNDGDLRNAQAALSDVVTYGVRAAQVSRETGKKMKHTEIAMRRINIRLEAIRRSLSVDDRPAVTTAIQKLETARAELLNQMFKK